MDPFLEKVGWVLVLAGIAGVGWVAKSLIKPWSDAALARSKAFVNLVETLQVTIPGMVKRVEELEASAKRSNVALSENTASNLRSSAAIDKLCEAFDSDKIRQTKKEMIEELAVRFQCKAHEVEIFMKEQETKSSKKHGH